MFELIDNEISKLEKDGHRLIKIEESNESYLILFTPSFDENYIFARLVFKDGTVTNETNDLKMFISKYSNTLRILNIYIYGENQNKGYGSILMNHLIEIAKKQFISEITGYMNPAKGEYDSRLRHFYKKHGFTIDKHRNISWKRNRLIFKLDA